MKKQFKTESKRLLDLMINSIYTNREIFLRELISNASDALDKRYFMSLNNSNKVDKNDLYILINTDKENRVLSIIDNGIGMDKSELETNLGTIAKSGSFDFKNDNKDDEIDIIGQFGVGFYSAFMVGKKVEVISKSINDDIAYKWESDGIDGYSIKEDSRDEIGTTINIYLKDDSDDENYSEYLEEYTLRNLIKKYSDYIRYPIKMFTTTSKLKEGSETEYEEVKEESILNSMLPLWKKNKNDISDEEYDEFYMNTFNDFEKPLKNIHFKVEGNLSYTALLYIPKKAPFNFYNTDFEPKIKLYSSGVLINDKAKELISDYFRFISGIVDSEDLSLNISRETLQQNRQVKALKTSLEKKIRTYLLDLLNNNREEYEAMFDEFGVNIKYGLYQDYGTHIEILKDLIMFKSSKEDKYTTFKEYIDRIKDDNKFIYYVSGSSVDEIKKLPLMKKYIEKDIEVLYLIDSVDEFALSMMRAYEDYEFKSINKGDSNLESDEEKETIKEKTLENKDLLELMKNELKDRVVDVRISSRLVSDPVCLVSDDGISIEMEKVLSQTNNDYIKAKKILEINPNHEIFNTLINVYSKDKDLIGKYSNLLYNQALLIEGLNIDDPVEYANNICDLIIKANK